jgi:hypothetical protein
VSAYGGTGSAALGPAGRAARAYVSAHTAGVLAKQASSSAEAARAAADAAGQVASGLQEYASSHGGSSPGSSSPGGSSGIGGGRRVAPGQAGGAQARQQQGRGQAQQQQGPAAGAAAGIQDAGELGPLGSDSDDEDAGNSPLDMELVEAAAVVGQHSAGEEAASGAEDSAGEEEDDGEEGPAAAAPALQRAQPGDEEALAAAVADAAALDASEIDAAARDAKEWAAEASSAAAAASEAAKDAGRLARVARARAGQAVVAAADGSADDADRLAPEAQQAAGKAAGPAKAAKEAAERAQALSQALVPDDVLQELAQQARGGRARSSGCRGRKRGSFNGGGVHACRAWCAQCLPPGSCTGVRCAARASRLTGTSPPPTAPAGRAVAILRALARATPEEERTPLQHSLLRGSDALAARRQVYVALKAERKLKPRQAEQLAALAREFQLAAEIAGGRLAGRRALPRRSGCVHTLAQRSPSRAAWARAPRAPAAPGARQPLQDERLSWGRGPAARRPHQPAHPPAPRRQGLWGQQEGQAGGDDG